MLKRISYNDTETAGALVMDGFPIALTLERPWKENESDISCIPTGNYTCQRVISPKFGETFEITGVPGRSNILFHSGNTDLDTHGCVLLGSSFGQLNGFNAVLSSKPAFAEFMRRMDGLSTFQLLVTG